MKKFLAIDTSSKYLTVVVFNEQPFVTFLPDCAMNHSVVLMDAIEETFQNAGIAAKDCDFFACSVGAGSFTGIRIGISCIKGFALTFQKPVLPVTSFESIAYNTQGNLFSVIDAMHGKYYVCGFDENKRVTKEPCYLSEEETLALRAEGKLCSFEALPFETEKADVCQGFLQAVLAKADQASAQESLTALYIRKSQAEEALG